MSECDGEAWIMRRSWPTGSCCALEGERIIQLLYITNIILLTSVIRTVVVIQFGVTVSLMSPHDMFGQTQMGLGGHSSNPFETRH